ncbi:MAG: HK97 family phage prohead protease [Rhodocyclaceae bacterium]
MQRKGGAFKTRAFEWDTKAVNEDGLFSGYGSVFGVVDSYREVVVPGAFTESLAELADKGRALPILWQHRSGEPIGDWKSLKEDATGLKGDGALWLDDAPYAKVAYRGMKARAITGLSIGYYVREDSYDEKTRIRTLKRLELVEVSIVTVPANDEARIEAVKSRIAHGELPTLSDFEGLLREAGFSKSQAAIIANRGLKHLLQSESGGTASNASRLLDSLKTITF